MKKLVLVPESRFRALVESETKSTSGDVIDAVINPEREEMVKKFRMGEAILRDDNQSDDVKMTNYNNAMQSFVTQRDKVKMKLAPKPYLTANSIKVPTENDIIAKMRQKTIEPLPLNLQPTAQKLLEHVKAHGDKRVINLSPNGNVSVKGKKLNPENGGEISELVSDILRAPSARRGDNPNRRSFLEALVKMDVPEAWIKNKTARAEFQFLKRNKDASDDKKEFRTPPKGIPDRMLAREDVVSAEQGTESDSLSSVNKSTTVARRKKQVSRLTPSKSKTNIDWVETE